MTSLCRTISTLLLGVTLGLTGTAYAQQAPAPPVFEGPLFSDGSSALRIGQDYALAGGESAREITVILGNATIDGRVDRDVVVILGKAQIGTTAEIGGELVVIGGSASISPGAKVDEGLVVVGGALNAPAEFRPGGEFIVIGSSAVGNRLEALLPWITRGLLWGRLIVPGLTWMWGFLAILFLVYLALSLVFHRPVRSCAETLAAKPMTAFLTGLLVLLLTGPVILLLAISIIGLAVVPLVACAILVAGVIGKLGVLRWIGMSAVQESADDSRAQAARSFAIGFVVISIGYMIPLIGLATLALSSVLSLGGATLSFMAGYRRENPLPPPRPRVEPPPPAPAPTWSPPVETAPMPEPSPPAAAAYQSSVAGTAPSDLLSFPHAAFLDRLAAFILDIILMAIARQILLPYWLTRGTDSLFFLLLVYHVGFWVWKGTTIGGIICQLRLVRIDGASLRLVDAIVRGFSAIFSLAVLGIGGLWILRDPDRQAWHDRIAGTFVVKVPRNWPI